MKRVLIISPHFPPVNAADMQRLRMSVPYFEKFDWLAELVTVSDSYVDMVKDPLLMQSIPSTIIIHTVKAFSKKWTSKVGLGSLALRSIWFYREKVNELLSSQRFDLIYFSTTEFPVCILGAYWKKKYGIPYVIDMQDPWHSDYYQDKPKHQRPKKYWFSYRLHKFLEPIAMNSVSGIISVSQAYIETLQERYPRLCKVPCKTITFGAFEKDFEVAAANSSLLDLMFSVNTNINLVYVGRGGYDMQPAVRLLFDALRLGLQRDPEVFERVHFHFIGTSYAPSGKGIPTISPIAKEMNVTTFVTEHTNRIGFYQSIRNLQEASGLIIIGSNSSSYTASKLYPYILARKQILAVLHPHSSAVKILKDCHSGDLINFDDEPQKIYGAFKAFLLKIKTNKDIATDWNEFNRYTAVALTEKQVELFNEVIQ